MGPEQAGDGITASPAETMSEQERNAETARKGSDNHPDSWTTAPEPEEQVPVPPAAAFESDLPERYRFRAGDQVHCTFTHSSPLSKDVVYNVAHVGDKGGVYLEEFPDREFIPGRFQRIENSELVGESGPELLNVPEGSKVLPLDHKSLTVGKTYRLRWSDGTQTFSRVGELISAVDDHALLRDEDGHHLTTSLPADLTEVPENGEHD